MDLGFDDADFDLVFASDIDPIACETLRRNAGRGLRSSPQIFRGDIRSLDLEILPEDIDVVIGGPPCQPYSASGRRAGGAAGSLDLRGNLFQAYTNAIRKLSPVVFVFENVRGILATNKGQDWSEIVRTFLTLGYNLSFRILDACDYGIPQHRERLFLVGHRMPGDFLFPRPSFGPDSLGKKPHTTLRQAFRDIPQIEDLDALELRDGKYSHLLAHVPVGENYLHFTSKRGHAAPVFAYRSRFSDFLYKANPEAPSKTIIASPGKYTGPFHWENRSFSIAEYKALQGFPQSYEFSGKRADVVHQIGNSVAPPVAFALAQAIKNQIFGASGHLDLLPASTVLTFDQRKGKLAQNTRARHEAVVSSSIKHSPVSLFRASDYKSILYSSITEHETAVEAKVISKNRVLLTVGGKRGAIKLASMELKLAGPQTSTLFHEQDEAEFNLSLEVFGDGTDSIQSMWNAVDEWVIRSSSFHSLYELYGHFTEPNPIFTVSSFVQHLDLPVCRFAAHLTDFSNCSRYFPRTHLLSMFGESFHSSKFEDLVRMLRSYRFDVRCHETNIAIDPDVYMVCYPFTLPTRKQMNFSVRERSKPVQHELAV